MKTLELNHVAIYVSDVKASCEFYARVLRLEQVPRPAFDFPGAWFRLGSTQELQICGSNVAATPPRQRGNHFALRVEDIEAWCQLLQPQGVIVRGPVRRPDGATQIFLSDPDGNLVELFTGPSSVT